MVIILLIVSILYSKLSLMMVLFGIYRQSLIKLLKEQMMMIIL